VTLIINNDGVRSLLTMAETIDALEQSYRDLFRSETVCRPRIDIQIPIPGSRQMPARKDQGSPDLRYFKKAQN
jgi:hypothetical protein